jgi:hypothetical protein
VLFAPRHGFFLFHPAGLLAVLGLVALAVSGGSASRRQAAILGLLWFFAAALLHGCWSAWANEGGWGQRFLAEPTAVLALGFAGLLERPKARAGRVAAMLASLAFGYVLFFAAVAELVQPPRGFPWPQTLADYRPLLTHPPSWSELRSGLLRASASLRLLCGNPAGANL